MKQKILMVLFFLAVGSPIYAQATDDWEEVYGQTEEMEEKNETDWEEMYDQLSELKSHPINLNIATRSDLERLPFLTAQQIEDISDYLYHYAPIKTWGELAMIESLDERRRRLLRQFTFLGEVGKKGFPQWNNIMKWGKHELSATAKIPYYNRKGDENGYLGYKYKHGLTYRLGYGDYFKMGFLAAQDAGEPFFAHKNKWGYDYYSFYLLMRKMGRIKTLVLGKYRLRFGMGLVMNTDFMPGKVAGIASAGRIDNMLKAHASRNSGNYLQGVATTLALNKHWEATAFFSYRPIDTTPGDDNTSIRTILSSGYHRTESEMARKNNSRLLLAGGNINFSRMGFRSGLTYAFHTFDKPLQPNTAQLYHLHDAQGKSFYNLGINYGYLKRRIHIAGETAMNDNKAWGTINSVAFRMNSRLSFTLLQRFYSYKYHARFARSFSDGGETSNESGVYLGLTWNALRHLVLAAYTDYAYSPFPKYQRSASSQAFDQYFAATYTHRQSTFHARYRMRIREKDNEEKTMLIPHKEHRIRLLWEYEMSQLYLKTQADMVYSSYRKKSNGWMLTQHAGYDMKKMKLHGSVSYFHTDDFQSRIYNYERSTIHNFSFPSFHGQGLRYMLLAQTNLHQNLKLVVKHATTKYFDRNKIGSSFQEINRSSMTETDIQLTWRF